MSSKKDQIRQPGKGDHFIWATGGAIAFILVMTLILLCVIVYNGMGYFWPSEVTRLELVDGPFALGEQTGKETVVRNDIEISRKQLKIGNRDLYGLDFRWFDESEIKQADFPKDILVLERMEYGNFYGTLKSLQAEGVQLDTTAPLLTQFRSAVKQVHHAMKKVDEIEKRMSKMNNGMDKYRLRTLKLNYKDAENHAAKITELKAKQDVLRVAFDAEQNELLSYLAEQKAKTVTLIDVNGREVTMPIHDVVRFYQPNHMGFGGKLAYAGTKVGELLFDEPREANTEGGLFPAIFGTVLMVFIMSIFCMPMGVVTAIYLREYAKDGPVVRMVRIAVNNLAGVPSIVYGVFGLGFFIYGMGGFIDELFFPERLPTATFGTGGILWASLTLALLTVPVVIVSTEEALSSIPRGMREGSLAMGATKWQTITGVLLPMASPGILTGFILSMARAAGEVAPLMITGVVKLAPALPIDGSFPFIHLERKFMHLGFHIYDVGFQAPNIEAAKPMVFVTTLLLLGLVVLLNIAAIKFRNTMRKRYTMGAF